MITYWWIQTIVSRFRKRHYRRGALLRHRAPFLFLNWKWLVIFLSISLSGRDNFGEDELFYLMEKLPDYSKEHNEKALFAWHESYHLQGLTEFYLESASDSVLSILLQRMENVLVRRDDFRQVQTYDEQYTKELWKGSYAFPSWRNLHYQKGKAYAYFLHDALISAPMVQLAIFLKNKADLELPPSIFLKEKITSSLQLADFLYEKAGECIAGHEFKFYDGSYHNFVTAIPSEYPVNFKSAAARLLFLMSIYDSNGKISNSGVTYQQRFDLLFRDIEKAFLDEETLLFKYSNRFNSNIEDVSHGAITVRLIATIYENRDKVSDTLKQKIEKYHQLMGLTAEGLLTGAQIVDPILKNSLIWDTAYYIDGKTPRDKSYHRSFAALYIPVSKRDGQFFQKMQENLLNYYDKLQITGAQVRAHEFLAFVYLYRFGKGKNNAQ